MMVNYPEDDSKVDIIQLMLDSEYSDHIERNEWAIMENYQWFKDANRDEALELFEKDIVRLFNEMIGKEKN